MRYAHDGGGRDDDDDDNDDVYIMVYKADCEPAAAAAEAYVGHPLVNGHLIENAFSCKWN